MFYTFLESEVCYMVLDTQYVSLLGLYFMVSFPTPVRLLIPYISSHSHVHIYILDYFTTSPGTFAAPEDHSLLGYSTV
jgi:hypothetical protein